MINNDMAYYHFEVTVKDVTLALSEACRVFLIISCDNSKVESKPLLMEDNIVQFEESFDLTIMLYKLKESGKLMDKDIKIGVHSISNMNKIALLGDCNINIIPFTGKLENDFQLCRLKNCVDQNGSITFKIKSEPMERMPEDLKSTMDITKNEQVHKLSLKLKTTNGTKLADEDKGWRTKFEEALKEKEEWISKYELLKNVNKRNSIDVYDSKRNSEVNFMKQIKEKDEAIVVIRQQADETKLELERIKKNNEINELSLHNELNVLKQNQEKHKKEINDISDEYQKYRNGKVN